MIANNLIVWASFSFLKGEFDSQFQGFRDFNVFTDIVVEIHDLILLVLNIFQFSNDR